ncbi:MAG: glycosyltransferase family 2 protein [Candidatus Methanoperedens sp.]|nr:glycosyltransferase family 2 protein [Candidatus Methanoperedens sp.]
MSLCISNKIDSFEPDDCNYNEADRITDNIDYIVHKKRSAVSRKGVIAILPAFNEEISIGSMVLHAREHAERVIVVDDGSLDRTAEIARFAGAEVISHTKNMGKGAALKTGFDLAGQNGSKVIVTMDTDGQHNPAEIPKLVSPILQGEADMVNGSRYMNGKDKNTPFYRRIGQNVLDKATNLNSGLHITDTQSGFRAFARHTLPVFRFKSNGLAIESEMLKDASNAGLNIKEVEIGVRYDVDCSSENPLSHGIKVLIKVLEDIELNRPLYYFTAPGMVLSAVGLAMGMKFLQDFYYGRGLMFGPTLLMIILTLLGTFLAFTGIILHSMARLFNEHKKGISRNNEPPQSRVVLHKPDKANEFALPTPQIPNRNISAEPSSNKNVS